MEEAKEDTTKLEQPDNDNDDDVVADYGYNEISERTLEHSEGTTSRRRLNVTSDASPRTSHVAFNPTRVLFYAPPRQRQKWGDTQVLPRVNWGDLFFDLFYVAATYNVSYIIVDSPNRKGLLYAAGTFLPVMGIWNHKTFYDARYATESDVVHRFLHASFMVVLGVAVSHIRTVEVLSNAAGDSSMLVFALMLVVDRIFAMSLYAEVYFKGVGQKQVKYAAFRDISFGCIGLVFYSAATVIAGIEYFGSGISGKDYYRILADTATDAVEETASGYDKDLPQSTHVPIYLCICGHVVWAVSYFTNIIFCFPGGGRHKEFAVPLNVDFVVHRFGEWNMLMLGESIFSLLIVDVAQEGNDFFAVFYLSLLTIIFLQFLHFQSQPHNPDTHAMRRHKNIGSMWSMIQQLFSFCLVILGTCYTFFLTFSGEDTSPPNVRTLASSSYALADFHDIADLYSGTLAIIFLCLNGSNLLHLGKEEVHIRFGIKGGVDWKIIATVLGHAGLIAISATMSQWLKTPKDIAIAGLLCVVAQLSMRKVESIHSTHKRRRLIAGPRGGKPIAVATDDETGDAPWPDVTHARAEKPEKTADP